MNIPSHATKVFTGILFDVYHWEQKLFDGSSATYEGLDRKNDGVTILAASEDKIYYAEETQAEIHLSFTTLPGGKREAGETPLETAKRELLEETGMISNDWEPLWIQDNFSTKIQWTVHTFIARNARKITEQSLDPGEKITIQEATFSEFLDISAEPNFRNEDVSIRLMRMRLYAPKKLENLKKKLFG